MTHPRRDAIIVGAGHNGLVAAAYLAQAGRDVLVVERDDIPGGAVSTVERFPGYRVDRGSSAHLMIRHSPIPDELELSAHGLRYLDCDPWAFVPATDSAPAIVFRTDLDATCASIERSCGRRDADAYRRFVGTWAPRARAVMSSFYRPATPARFGSAFLGLGDTATTARRGPLGRRSGQLLSLTQELMASGDALLDRWFDAEHLKAGLAWFGAQSGPPMSAPGTAPMIGFAALMHDIPPGRAVGGSGALTEALIHRLAADGGEVRCRSAAHTISRCGDHWRVGFGGDSNGDGDSDGDGESACATTVISAAHILVTLDLLAAGGFDAATIARWRAEVVVGTGIGMAVRLGTTGLPDYRDLPAGLPAHGVHSGLGLLVTDRAQLVRAQAAAAVGELPPRPACVAMSFSAIDDTLAPPDRHVINAWAQWHPRHLAGGQDWSTVAERAADAVCAEIDRFAPGFGDSIVHRHIQTPADLESELGLIGGNIMHVEMSIDQMFMWRPHPDLATHRVPGADGVLLAGASTHPGGGVTGASGRIAAHAVLGGGGHLRRFRTRGGRGLR
ncbi:NAD(P)/FAD-dependent oxidoreductase [Gordonia sp. ABSL1-1]|uniref:phytoene desaturase family protein n=1 Tax=Gordonia sp. ABSL1-1 TaxID=3053923 RepID=UPI002573A2B0|nr:NAD(P)/FAD-dependent oxidoreductase [Gordonia sp. ABSL1-1]MDL9937393.1 NAD(P)/FAD-dependent oxidoreductase [Gordonia sp. ABSL1-1]